MLKKGLLTAALSLGLVIAPSMAAANTEEVEETKTEIVKPKQDVTMKSGGTVPTGG
ncbi:hypothetical protein V1503_24830 [Bacillus sp. SCS-151]|uniref:hypothetical protein n=1 Tax=Nanhaiella sioensis TaxID=3115293 RepID=UPI00397ACCD9